MPPEAGEREPKAPAARLVPGATASGPYRVSRFLGVPVSTLHQWRYLGRGPAAFRVGKHLRYDPDAVRRWLVDECADEPAGTGGRQHRQTSNGAWRARYRDARGNEHAQHFDRKVDAQRWLSSVEIAQARGEWLDPSLAQVRIGERAQKLAGPPGPAQGLDPGPLRARRPPADAARAGRVFRSRRSTYADVGSWVYQLSA